MIALSLVRSCEAMMKKGSASFFEAFSKLPSPKREAVYVIYSFCRMIDDSVDEPENAPYTLMELRKLFDSLDTTEGHFIWPSLRWLFAEFPVTKAPFYKQMSGQLSDVSFTTYETMKELEDYCEKVAGSVGEMLLPVLHDNPTEKIAKAGIYLGKAMQIVNIIRDVGEDLARGRRYIPIEVMNRFHYSVREYEQSQVTESFKHMLDELMVLSKYWFVRGMEDLETYPDSSAFSIRLAAGYYASIMDEIIDQQYQVFTKRAIVSQAKKLEIFGRVLSQGELFSLNREQAYVLPV